MFTAQQSEPATKQLAMFSPTSIPIELLELDNNLALFSQAIGQNFGTLNELVGLLDSYKMFNQDLPELLQSLRIFDVEYETNLEVITKIYLQLSEV